MVLIAGIDLNCIDDYEAHENPTLRMITFQEFTVQLLDPEWQKHFLPFDTVIIRTYDLSINHLYVPLRTLRN